MIIIGLAGGRPRDRVEIANRLQQAGGARLETWAGGNQKSDRPAARVRDLCIALRPNMRKHDSAGLVVVNVLTKEEADEIRRRGGVIWHVSTQPSETVPIELGDPLVSTMHGGHRHFRDSIQLLSELLMHLAGH